MSLKLAVGLDKFEKMGELMRSRNQAIREGKNASAGGQSTPSQYASVAHEHFALIKREGGERVVYVTHTTGFGAHKGVPFCHEVMDPSLAHYAYPLMASQFKQDLGTLSEFLAKDPQRTEFWRQLGKLKTKVSMDDLTSVRAILWAESNGLPPLPTSAKTAYEAVTKNFEPTYAFRMTKIEKEVVAMRHRVG